MFYFYCTFVYYSVLITVIVVVKIRKILTGSVGHCWLDHLTRKIIPEMICNMSSGMLNPITLHTMSQRYIMGNVIGRITVCIYSVCAAANGQ